MKKFILFFFLFYILFLSSRTLARADWVDCPVTAVSPNGATLSGSDSNKILSDADHEYVGVWANCVPDSHGLKVQFQTSAPANVYFQNTDGSFIYNSFSGTTVDSYILTDPKQIASLTTSTLPGLIFGDPHIVPVAYSHFQIFNWSPATPTPTSSPSPTPTPTSTPTPSPTPTSMSATISISPSTSSPIIGVPFTVDAVIDGGGQAFNAAQATISVSPNLTITGFFSPNASACNFQYTQIP